MFIVIVKKKKKKSGFIEMKGNIWDFKEIDRIVEKIADKFLCEFRLYPDRDSMRLIDKDEVVDKDGFYYLFSETLRPPGWLKNAEIFYRLYLKGMRPKVLVDNEGYFENVTNGFFDPPIKYNKRSKVLRIDNEPVLSLELTKRTLDNLEYFNELKKEIVKKLRNFSESIRKDKEINKKIFFLTSSKDCWSLEKIDPTISMGFFYPGNIGFKKKVFRKGTGKISVCVEHYRFI